MPIRGLVGGIEEVKTFMFCPNCGATNDSKQNYCRFCGLDMRASARSLTTQLAFGKDSDSLKKLRTIKRFVNIASAVLAGIWIVCEIVDAFTVLEFGKGVMGISLGLFILFQIIQGTVGYFLRKDRQISKESEQRQIEDFEGKETGKLLTDNQIEPVPSVIESSTELFPIENKTRKFE